MQAEGSSLGGDIIFSAMIFVLVLLGLVDFSGTVILPNSCCQQNLKVDREYFNIREYFNAETSFDPIPHGVFWITHTWGGQILPAPCNTAILKDMDLKFGMLK